jgi:hypothetical protein
LNDLSISIALFLVVAFAIVLMSTLYAQPDDAKALRSVPLRYAKFLLWCGGIVGAMLLVERLFLQVGSA